MFNTLQRELILRKNEISTPLQTIYFGGGTPSLLSYTQIEWLFETIHKYFTVLPNAEITLEANPDDLTTKYLTDLSKTSINRLSIGVQSFHQKDLDLMHRAHSNTEAIDCIKKAQDIGFKNLNIDLIYGIPKATEKEWLFNLKQFFNLEIPHLSAYALTVEKKTALDHFIKSGKIQPLNEEQAFRDYDILTKVMQKNNYTHYEISNFAKTNFIAKHNTSYWQGKHYTGIGPSAHSYNGRERSWNIAHNNKYIKSINNNILPSEKEVLSQNDKFNEYIMTGLRTIWGIDLQFIKSNFGQLIYEKTKTKTDLLTKEQKLVNTKNTQYRLSETALFYSDGIIADLFLT